MVEITWTTREAGPATLVAGVCRTSGRVPRRVRLEAPEDCPVWSPRRDPERVRWRGRIVDLRLPADGTTPVGFATPAPAPAPPLTVVVDEPCTGTEADGSPTAAAGSEVPADSKATADHEAVARRLPSPAPPAAAVPSRVDPSPPAAVSAWLDDAEERVEAAGRRTATDDGTGGTALLGARLERVAERAGALAERATTTATITGARRGDRR